MISDLRAEQMSYRAAQTRGELNERRHNGRLFLTRQERRELDLADYVEYLELRLEVRAGVLRGCGRFVDRLKTERDRLSTMLDGARLVLTPQPPGTILVSRGILESIGAMFDGVVDLDLGARQTAAHQGRETVDEILSIIQTLEMSPHE